MSLDPRSPILVGLHQLAQRVDDPLEGDEPLEMMIAATRAAAEDAGCPALLEQADVVCVVRGRWPYENPTGRSLTPEACPGTAMIKGTRVASSHRERFAQRPFSPRWRP